MKRTVVLVMVLLLVFVQFGAYADDLGIQIIGGPEGVAATPMSLDDVQLGNDYSIDGYANVKFNEYMVVDYFAQFGEKEDYGTWHNNNQDIWQVFAYGTSNLEYGSWRFNDASWMESGNDGQFIWLTMDITNYQKQPVDFSQDMTVKVVYMDDYEFNGWVRQIDNDLIAKDASDYGVSRFGGEKTDYPNAIVLNPKFNHAIDMMYTGHYVIGCTLPNTVVEDKKGPLRVEIKLGENDLTYNILK